MIIFVCLKIKVERWKIKIQQSKIKYIKGKRSYTCSKLKLNVFNKFHICRFKDYQIHGKGPKLCSQHKQMEYLVAAILGTPFFIQNKFPVWNVQSYIVIVGFKIVFIVIRKTEDDETYELFTSLIVVRDIL